MFTRERGELNSAFAVSGDEHFDTMCRGGGAQCVVKVCRERGRGEVTEWEPKEGGSTLEPAHVLVKKEVRVGLAIVALDVLVLVVAEPGVVADGGEEGKVVVGAGVGVARVDGGVCGRERVDKLGAEGVELLGGVRVRLWDGHCCGCGAGRLRRRWRLGRNGVWQWSMWTSSGFKASRAVRNC